MNLDSAASFLLEMHFGSRDKLDMSSEQYTLNEMTVDAMRNAHSTRYTYCRARPFTHNILTATRCVSRDGWGGLKVY